MDSFQLQTIKIQELKDEVIALEMVIRSLENKKKRIKTRLQKDLTQLVQIKRAQEDTLVLSKFLGGESNED